MAIKSNELTTSDLVKRTKSLFLNLRSWETAREKGSGIQDKFHNEYGEKVEDIQYPRLRRKAERALSRIEERQRLDDEIPVRFIGSINDPEYGVDSYANKDIFWDLIDSLYRTKRDRARKSEDSIDAQGDLSFAVLHSEQSEGGYVYFSTTISYDEDRKETLVVRRGTLANPKDYNREGLEYDEEATLRPGEEVGKGDLALLNDYMIAAGAMIPRLGDQASKLNTWNYNKLRNEIDTAIEHSPESEMDRLFETYRDHLD
jgi:hypothetical protein